MFEVIKLVYRRIRELREDSDLTQAQVGRTLNLSQRAYAYYESGKRNITPEVLIKLAQLYNTTVDYILGLSDERNK